MRPPPSVSLRGPGLGISHTRGTATRCSGGKYLFFKKEFLRKKFCMSPVENGSKRETFSIFFLSFFPLPFFSASLCKKREEEEQEKKVFFDLSPALLPSVSEEDDGKYLTDLFPIYANIRVYFYLFFHKRRLRHIPAPLSRAALLWRGGRGS